MSEQAVRAALEKRLDALVSAILTAWENVSFTLPDEATPYQRVDLLRAQPVNPEMGATLKRLQGVLQVTLFYPQADGPGAAEAQADAIANWFPRGLALVEAGVTVQVDQTPYVMPGFADGDRWAVPVRIPYFANITS